MKNLKMRRVNKGLSGEQLGSLVGVQKSAISKYERGEIQPSQEVLLKLSEVLECSVDYLLGKTNNPSPLENETEEFRSVARDLMSMKPDNREALIKLIKSMSSVGRKALDDE